MSVDRIFLVTGATGAVGSAIVPLLLAEPSTKVYVLLRASSDEALGSRMQALLDYWGDWVDRQDLPDRLVGVRGDIGHPYLKMSEEEYEKLAGTVTHIVHSAGNVKLNQTIGAARASAVLAVEQVVAFARACGRSRPYPKIEYLSTVGVAGRRSGLIPEERLGSEWGYHNTYEQAKAEAEKVMLREIDAGLPATIHRPSMVVGDSRDGRIIHFQVFYYLAPFLAGSRTGGVLPKFGHVKLDLVPADCVAKTIVASTRRHDSIGKILHLCSGPLRAAPLAELGDSLRHFFAEHGERVFTPRYLPRSLLRGLVRIGRSLASDRTRRGLDSLPYFLDYLDEAQLFVNERTTEFFAADGLESPPVEQFLPVVMRYWYARRSREIH